MIKKVVVMTDKEKLDKFEPARGQVPGIHKEE